MNDEPQHPGGLDDAVARRQRQRRIWQASGERPLARNLAMVGSLGWLIVVPALLGAFAGRWFDQKLGTGITFTAALLVVGMALGCWLAWRRIRQA